MKFAYFLAIAEGAQNAGDGDTPHDPEAMAFCQGKFFGKLRLTTKKLHKILETQPSYQINLR